MATRTRRRRGERGQSLVEFALIIPFFLILVFAIADFGLGLRAWITVTNSAREGARLAAVTCATNDASVGNIQTRAVDTSAGLLTPADVSVTNCPGASTESVVVTVNYDYTMVTPLGSLMNFISGGTIPSSISMTSAADMRLE